VFFAVDGDELLGAALLVLEAAVRDRARPQPELLLQPVDGVEGGQLLLVHHVDAVLPVLHGVEAVGLFDGEIFRALLELHFDTSNVNVGSSGSL
jgi:hypothetical protein